MPGSPHPPEVPAIEGVARVGEGHVRAAPAAPLPGVLLDLGFDPDAIFAEVGFDREWLRDPESTVRFDTVGALLTHCVKRTGRADLMLLVAQQLDVSVLGIVGLLARHSSDIGSAWRSAIERLHLHDRGAVIALELSGEFATLSYGIYQRDVDGAGLIHLLAMGIGQRIMQGLCGRQWHATEVQLPIRRPADEAPFRRFFGSSLRFNAESAAMVFPAELLRRPIAGADPAVRRTIVALMDQLERESSRGIGTAVCRVLRAMLVAGSVSESGVAEAFAMHRRTLNRRLRGEGTTFRRLLEETRFEVARQLLQDTDAAVDQIASSLGYSGSTAFGRAFKRWSGRAPQLWRQDGRTRQGG